VTVPSLLTVYVPSPGTVKEVFEQVFGVSATTGGDAEALARPHNFTDVATNGKSVAPGVSLEVGVYVWFVSYASVIASAVAVGTGGGPTVGVIVVFTKRSNESFA
jgi:hypothetical protein